MTAPVCWVDTETTGLDPVRHEVYEVGLITPDGTEYEWWLPVDCSKADPIALGIGRFHERHPYGNAYPYKSGLTKGGRLACTSPGDFAREFAKLTHGLHLAGAVISFDERRLWDLLRGQGVTPSWHYHIIDVEALAAGYIARLVKSGLVTRVRNRVEEMVDISPLPPWDSTQLSLAVGVDPEKFDRHTALADAKWAKAIYESVMGSAA